MNTLNTIITASLFFGLGLSSARAQHDISGSENPSRAPECKTIEPALSKIYGVGATSLNYFISANGYLVYVITNQGNKVLDTRTGKLFDVPGGVDPVPTPDGKYFTTPGLSFYSAEDLKKGIAEGKEHFSDLPTIQDRNGGFGVYQSIGVLPGTKTYRAATDRDGSTFAEYEPSEDGKSVKLVREPAQLCPNIGAGTDRTGSRFEMMQLPMISKDGMHLSVYDSTTQTTKIYSIKDPTNCELELDLGMPAGKVDFDFTGNKIAFHTDFYGFISHYISDVSSDLTRDIVVMNLNKDKTGKFTSIDSFARLTHSLNKGSGTYYPRWTEDGSLYATRFLNSEYSVGKFDIKNEKFAPYWSPKTQSQPAFDKEQAKRYALGALIAEKCLDTPESLSLFDRSLFALSLDPAACESLVTKYWADEKLDNKIKGDMDRLPIGDAGKKSIAELTIDDLKALCQSGSASTEKAEQVGDTLKHNKTMQETFTSSCAECHANGFTDESGKVAPKFSLSTMTEGELFRSLRLMQSGAMPPEGSEALSPEKKKLLQDLFKQKLNDTGDAQ
ncbi:MAG: cytochrome c [Bdellovibrionota bacterium]